jgi:hypothetical protein
MLPFPRSDSAARPLSSAAFARSGLRPLALSTATTSTTAAASLALAGGADAKNPQKMESPALKFVIGAGVALSYEFALGHYLEFVKIMKQTKPGNSYLTLTKEMVANKGLIGIWDGFFPWGAIQGVAKGSVFSWGHAFSRQAVQPMVERGTITKDAAEVIAGGVGGGFQGFVLSPTLLLKTRVMTDPVFRQEMTPMETATKSLLVGMKVIRNEGVLALMKGSGMFSVKRVADWSTRFLFSVEAENILFKRADPDHKLTMGEKVTASLAGGVVSALVTLPMDVMVAQIQQASKAGVKVSVVGVIKEQYKRGGMKQIANFGTTGLVVRVMHTSFTTMIMKTATSIVYEMVEGRS